MTGIDHLAADFLSAPNGEPVLIVEAARWRRPAVPLQAIVIGIDADGSLPACAHEDFDLLVTGADAPPRPWIPASPFGAAATATALAEAIRTMPIAATVAAQLLRLSDRLPLADALTAESFAYASLLGGDEFRRWMARRPAPLATDASRTGDVLTIDRHGDEVVITLDSPATRNAMTAEMRDALYEALVAVLDDPTEPRLLLRGAGRCFSVGGAIEEFGSATDLAEAHLVRTLRSCARALASLGERATVELRGACIGSGIEIAAAAHRRLAHSDAWFQLPELAMGLIPGAGGTVTVARAITRQRLMWLLITAKRIDARQALEWGLVHAVSEAR